MNPAELDGCDGVSPTHEGNHMIHIMRAQIINTIKGHNEAIGLYVSISMFAQCTVFTCFSVFG